MATGHLEPSTTELHRQGRALGVVTHSPLEEQALRRALQAVPGLYEQELKALEQAEEKAANDRRYGAFLSSASVRTRLGGFSPQRLNKLISTHQILRGKTHDQPTLQRNVFPAFQFEGKHVNPRMVPIFRVLLPVAADDWSVIDWMTTPLPELEGGTPAQVLAIPDPAAAERVLALAVEDASAWAA